jgi:hypothetical protein
VRRLPRTRSSSLLRSHCGRSARWPRSEADQRVSRHSPRVDCHRHLRVPERGDSASTRWSWLRHPHASKGDPILACTWSSRKWSGRAPAGWELIRVFIGRSGRDDVLASDDETLIALAHQEVAERLEVSAPPRLDPRPSLAARHAAVCPRSPERIARIESHPAQTPTALSCRQRLPWRRAFPIALLRVSAPRTRQ